MRKSNILLFIFGISVAFLVFTACETPTTKVVRATPLEPKPEIPAEIPAQINVAEEQSPASAAALAHDTETVTEPPKPLVAPHYTNYNQFIGSGWVDIGRWSEETGIAKPTLIPGTVPAYQLRLSDGVIQIAAGNHFVHWNEMLLGLGYPARSGHAGLQMHSIDIEKTILPLAVPFYFNGAEKIVLLDPGHGGVNGGTQSPHTHQIEKNLTMDWALRVKRLLIGTGWTVMLTRTNDIDLTLAQRVALADEVQPDLFVSLHFNAMNAAAKSNAESGIETYCLTPAGLPSNITREFEDDPSKIFPNNQFDSENLQWAVRFHHQLLAATGAHDRGVRRARFMTVLRDQRRPAVLIEGGYLSSPNESRLLSEASYREKLAWAVAAAIVKQ